MSYTNFSQLRLHFPEERQREQLVQDQQVSLLGTELTSFYGAAIDAVSLVVKRMSQGDLLRLQLPLTLTGSVLPGGTLVRGSVVVASDSSLRVRYLEQTDYTVNYASATIKRISSGGIAEGALVTIWYETHAIFAVGTDYLIDADRGEMRRTNSGAIRDGESVLLDYRPVMLSLPDELLTQAAALANQQIAQEIDPSGEFEADAFLGLAATYRALAISCEGASSRELSRRDGNAQVAQSWLTLSERYERRSRELLGQFRPPILAPAAPQHT